MSERMNNLVVGAEILFLLFGVVFLLAFFYEKWEKWSRQRKRRKDLVSDYPSRSSPVRGSSVKRTVSHRARGSSYGAQHDGSYVYVAPHDLHSHGGDYSSDSCDSGDSGGCDGGGCDGGGD